MDGYQINQVADFLKQTTMAREKTARGYLELNGWNVPQALADYFADMNRGNVD